MFEQPPKSVCDLLISAAFSNNQPTGRAVQRSGIELRTIPYDLVHATVDLVLRQCHAEQGHHLPRATRFPKCQHGMSLQEFETFPPWRTRVEELDDYGSSRSAVRQGTFLVERENVIGNPAYAKLREQLSVVMDQALRTSTSLQALKMPVKEKTSR